jgi:AraC-like DNA-binding protein
MYDQIREDTLFIILYSVVTAMAAMASCYLLFRRANAIAPDITTPVRLRRWTAAFFAAFALNHVWYMPIFFLSSSEDIRLCDLIGGLLDCMTVFPLMIVLLFMMLQDRRRPLWPVAVMFAPLTVGNALCVATLSYDFLPIVYIYALLMSMGLIIYMVHALRQYGRWLRDNYADLEHKEVWQSFVVLAIILLVFVVYALTNENQIFIYVMLVICAVFICYLLWRVETISDLSIPIQSDTAIAVDDVADLNVPDERGRGISPGAKFSLSQNIGPLLKQYCEEPQLYLQYDISLSQLATSIGINRSYLSKHFALQGITYNAYINGLRIQHFINLYHEKVTTHQPVSAQQLAYQSGFRSYNTFSVAFKKMKGMTVTEWIRNQISA